MSENNIQCSCGSADLEEITGKYNLAAGLGAAGALGLVGGLMMGPIGLAAGAALGAYGGSTKRNVSDGSVVKRFKCSSCGKKFEICPHCGDELVLITARYNGNVPSGYRAKNGEKCAKCHFLIEKPGIVKRTPPPKIQ